MRYIYLSLLFVFMSCVKDTNKQYNIKYDGDKIVVNGYIDADEGCIVNISKTIPSSGKFGLDKFEVIDAKVYLLEAGNIITELKSMGNGLFKSDGFMPQIGKMYAIRATASQLESVESELVLVPDSAQISNLTMTKDNMSFLNNTSVFSFNLVDTQISQRNYFRINVKGDLSDFVDFFQYIQDLNINTLECDFETDRNFTFFSDKCFNGLSIDAKYIAQYGLSDKKHAELTFEIATTSKEYFDYIKSIQQPFGKSKAFLEPQTLYTNIKNGYGIFYGQNAKKYKFKL